MGDRVTLFEVGPRDGLQNEARPVPAADKIRLIDLLSGAGLPKIEAASFVSSRWVPQMADAAVVMAGIRRAPSVLYTALTPNLRGLDDAIASRADEVAVFASASEGFSRANINCTIADSLARYREVADAARAAGLAVRGYVSCITQCPFDGAVEPDAVRRVADALLRLGCYEISLGDTLGRAAPCEIACLLRSLADDLPAERLAGHFHDTSGRALRNVEVALDAGLRTFDASVGGLGGCPYAPGASGNVASEALAARLAELGLETGVDIARLAEAAAFARSLRNRA
ncbi:hydroxymethylglutaryl-CoA lyase [Aureimonas jatrophae]|uniref:Hydroxymethylglutaryl-CoA lyase n=1 Tax=Aureimonas jatrophae TaxID=1166073 RepID=A0A1H0C4H4_9HYPH|nr:hydroxymethylglutaryl-CoA lyase [Aureimonas jatrophae]MBB3949060.1 hydroxymethylglutaryl-CoA lyase [Aureimonas jatrophae]SDN52697.1 hydroxymethylglutaryl-CoA lyase [Aureimonas jatrophae]